MAADDTRRKKEPTRGKKSSKERTPGKKSANTTRGGKGSTNTKSQSTGKGKPSRPSQPQSETKPKPLRKSPEFAEIVTEWQHRLLQLDRRNSLLYFRATKTSVEIAEHSPSSIVDALDVNRRGLLFDYAEPRAQRRSPFQEEVEDGQEKDREPYIVTNDLRGKCPTLELQRRLGNLRRKAREWEEEQGLNVLFLALGFLNWVDEDGQEATAPLLLLPCHLERPSPRDAFRLTTDDEDLTANSTLAVKLVEFGVELPDGDADITDVDQYLRRVRTLVKKHPEWTVEDSVYLATFGYSKLAMWRDLDIIKKNGTGHYVVTTLGGLDGNDNSPSAPDPIPLPDDLSGAKLDDLLDVRDQFTILPADYSQLLAIAAAKGKANLVVHGPPGTGKSQTIANIIATLLAEDRSVLFVSEKTAALDVVKRRLDEKRLGSFCLDLHSERGKKASVYEQLRQSVEDDRRVPGLEFDYASLTAKRHYLNQVVRLLHMNRRPLGATVFSIQGEFASVRNAPHVDFRITDVASLDKERLAEIRHLADRLRLRRREFDEHWSSHWAALKEGIPSIELANSIRREMDSLTAELAALGDGVCSPARELGVAPPGSMQEVALLESIARHLSVAPGVPDIWCSDEVLERRIRDAECQQQAQTRRAELLAKLSLSDTQSMAGVGFGALRDALVLQSGDGKAFAAVLGDDWQRKVVRAGNVTSEELAWLLDNADGIRSTAEEISEFLAVPQARTLPALTAQADLLSKIAEIGPVPQDWVDIRSNPACEKLASHAADVGKKITLLEDFVKAKYEIAVLDLVDSDMVVRFRTDHQNRLARWFGSSYKNDSKRLRAYRFQRKKASFETELQLIGQVQELSQQRSNWRTLEPELSRHMGALCDGPYADWDLIASAIRDTRALLESFAGDRNHLAGIFTQPEHIEHARALASASQSRIEGLRKTLEAHLSDETARALDEGRYTIAEMHSLADKCLPLAQRIESISESSRRTLGHEYSSLEDLMQAATLAAQLQTIEGDFHRDSDRLRADFPGRFRDFETDWNEVLDSLRWTQALLDLDYSHENSDVLVEHAVQPRDSAVYVDIANTIDHAVSRFDSGTTRLREMFDVEKGPWESWKNARFEAIGSWAKTIYGDADSASDWLVYRGTVADSEKVIGNGAVDSIRQATSDSDEIPPIVERRVLGAWLDHIYAQEEMLAKFSAPEHCRVIDQFATLDQQLQLAAQREVRRRVYQRYPNVVAAAVKASELGILRGELSKRRRRWPVRKLFRTVPRLIQTLKPCFLVSPLAVSQFLPFSEESSETLSFDVVIFDEASQVFPEDAIPAILRADQCVLAGDQKQLPPSSFWRRSMSEDEDEYDLDDDAEMANQLAGRDSILDVAVGQTGRLFNDAHLNVHYRSRDESLIRFSNHHFYEDRLLTFPSPGVRGSWAGVHSHYVADGTYDAGATRTNRKEAECVVDLVFKHFRECAVGESLGVVALSRAQADLIERLVDERRIIERDIEDRFSERPDEPFFVKNLENVQGDERDHIIISIGYGPTVGSGAVPNRFGPLNAAGGERRLNVVVSRARVRIDLVHSLRAADIHSQQQGALLLKRYLEYVENPRQAFESQAIADADAESDSPFETAVERALVARGHKVARQVGVAGYRIDLAIEKEDGDRYDMGIECDGAAYHNSPAARDRDWLRQQVLEGLGWTIHRVWSTAWARNPDAELARIEEALAQARKRAKRAPTTPPKQSVDKTPPANKETEKKTTPAVTAVEHEAVELEAYEQASLHRPSMWTELREESRSNLVGLVQQVASVEGPVHRDVVVERIRVCYKLGRVKGSTRDLVQAAIEYARQRGAVKGAGDFIWSNDNQLNRKARKPVDKDINHMPIHEIETVTVAVARMTFGIPRGDLAVEVARTLGFNRTGGRIAEVLDKAIEQLLHQGRLTESFGMIHVKEDPD